MEFADGSYVYYTDIYEGQTGFEFADPILAFSGLPSFLFEWQALERTVRARWIKVLVPGQDFETDLRGPYRGHPREFPELVAKLLERLRVRRFHYFFHSYSTWYTALMTERFRDRILCIAGFGYPNFVRFIGGDEIFKVDIDKLLEAFELTRSQFLDRWSADVAFRGEYRQRALKFPFFSFFKTMPHPLQDLVIKFFTMYNDDGSALHIARKNRELTGFLRMFAQGANDQYIPLQYALEAQHHFAVDRPFSGRLQPQQLSYLRAKFPDLDLDRLDLENLSKNFMLVFPHTTHSVHHIRATELQLPVRTLLAVAESLALPV